MEDEKELTKAERRQALGSTAYYGGCGPHMFTREVTRELDDPDVSPIAVFRERMRIADVRELARRAGLDAGRVEDIETGMRKPDQRELETLARVFNLPPDCLSEWIDLI